MTPHYFIWKGIDSRDMGVQVEEYPPIVRAAPRVKQITVPGRAGTLTVGEGEYVYDAYTRKMKIAFRRSENIDQLLAWLTGTDILVCGNEPDRAYKTTMQQAFSADRLNRQIQHGELQLYTQPFKTTYPETVITLSASGTLTNPGTVPAQPVITFSGSGTRSITIGGVTVTISTAATAIIDCEAEMITDTDGNSLRASSSISGGEFPVLGLGDTTITLSGDYTTAEIRPGWRWI